MIYIVEDDPASREVLSGRLSLNRLEHQTFNSAEALLAALPRADPPTFFIVDIRLPGLTGLQLMEQLREDLRYQNIPAIAVTAQHNDRLVSSALHAGFKECLPKPIDGKYIVALIKKYSNPH